MDRDKSIDLLNGVAIILMVVGHALNDWQEVEGVRSFIYLFHMPVFFMAAGYVFNAKIGVDAQGLRMQIWKRCKRLWFVYFLSVSIAVLLTNAFIACNIYTDNPAINEYLHGDLIGTHQVLAWRETCKNILLTIPMIHRQELVVALWFLKSLFVLSVGYCIVEYLLRKILGRPVVGQSVLALVLLLFSWYHPWWWAGKVLFVLGGAQTFSGYALFHLGRIIRDRGWKSEKGSLTVGFAALVGLVLLCCFKRALHDPSLAFCLFLPVFLVGAILGWIMLVNLGSVLGGDNCLCWSTYNAGLGSSFSSVQVGKLSWNALLWAPYILYGGFPSIVSRVGLDAALYDCGSRIADRFVPRL